MAITARYGRSNLNLSPLNTDPHHLAIPYRLQFGNTDLNPRRLEVLEDNLRDAFSKHFQPMAIVYFTDDLSLYVINLKG